MRKLVLFALTWFIFVIWGLELGVVWLFKSITGSWIDQSSSMYLSKVWTINCLRLLALFALLKWLNLRFSDLTAGKFRWRELKYSTAIVAFLLAVEVAYFRSYSPQILQEFHYFLKISPNMWMTLISLMSEYVYYTLEILSVNLPLHWLAEAGQREVRYSSSHPSLGLCPRSQRRSCPLNSGAPPRSLCDNFCASHVLFRPKDGEPQGADFHVAGEYDVMSSQILRKPRRRKSPLKGGLLRGGGQL